MTFSYIISHRSSDSYRDRNLSTILKWIESLYYEKEVIVVEQDSERKLVLPENVIHIFAYNPGLFTKAWSMNIGTKSATGDIIVYCDSDCLFKTDEMNSFLSKFVNNVKNKKSNVGSPNMYSFVRLNEEQSIYVSENLKSFEIPVNTDRPGAAPGGGVFVATRESMFKMKLWDEDFTGWGGEDSAMGSKFVKHGMKIYREPLVGYHLYHDVKSSVPGYLANVSKNTELWKERYVRISKEQYMEYIETVNVDSLGYINRFK